MGKKAVSAIMLTVLLLISMLTLACNIQPVEAGGTIYIRANGSVGPLDAPISSVDNITYTFSDNIYDRIVVERSNIIVDGAGYTLQGNGTGNGFYLYDVGNVTIGNTNIKGFYYGVHLNSTSYSILFGNNLTNNSDSGIYLGYSSNNSISGNSITDNLWWGVLLKSSANNSIVGNNITANDSNGIYLIRSSNNTLSRNSIADNYDGIALSSSSNNRIVGNTVTANRADGIALLSSNHNNIIANNITNNYDGIELYHSSNNSLAGNNITNNEAGIWLYYSSNNKMVGNNIIDNEGGIYLRESSNNTIYHNNFINNVEQVYDYSWNYGGPMSLNVWDDGYPSGGNYWSDYTGVDDYSGPYQNETGSDGIGDTPYVIDTSNQDRYPLMQPRIPIPLPVYNINTGLGYVTIQAAINAANSGDTILVKEGTYYEHVVINKSITLIGEDRDRTIIDGSSTGTIMNITVSNVNVTCFTIQKSGSHPHCGIYVSSSSNNISYNIIKSCPGYYTGYAIDLCNSSNIVLSGNDIKENSETAIHLFGSSNITISGNNITDNEYGVGISHSSNNIIFANNISNNSEKAVSLYRAPNNIIARNNLLNNSGGISIPDYPSTNNTIYGNNITDNEYGIILIGSGNKIYHNNFIGNTYPPYFMLGSSQPNTWDDGYPSGGNYWSDYTGLDADGDGIGDTPYIINANNRDRYPLMNPWTPSWAPSDHVPPTPPEVQVGVKAGDWIKCDYTVTGWPSGTPYPEWLKVEILSVEETTATVRVTMHMSDGTEQSDTRDVDVVAGGGTFDTLFGFVIPANSTVGDSIIMGGDGFTFNVTIDGETTRTYAGASRTVVYASFSQDETQLTYYWDKQTGIMVEASVTSVGITGTAKATETNMWQAQPFGLPIDPTVFYTLIIVAVVMVAAVAFFIIRRKKKLPEEIEPPQS